MSNRISNGPVVMFVEDDPDDVVMVREALEQSLTPVQLYVACCPVLSRPLQKAPRGGRAA